MLKIEVNKSRRRRVLGAFVLVLSCACTAGPAERTEAGTRVATAPIPSQKPAFQVSAPPRPGRPGKSGFWDFTKAFLDFGGPPSSETTFTAAHVPSAAQPTVRGEDHLSAQDIAAYRKIFELQAQGDMEGADHFIKKLKDRRLYGRVLYQRYMHPTAYVSSFKELKSWLSLYGDHPGADKVYKLALKKLPEGVAKETLKKPAAVRGVLRYGDPTIVKGQRYRSARKRSASESKALRTLNRNVFSFLRKGKPEDAEKILKEAQADNLLDSVEFDGIQAEIAARYLYRGQTEKALKVADLSVRRSGLYVPEAAWIAGLSTWLNKDYKSAARYFESVARSSYASGWMAAGGAYWAARAHMHNGDMKAAQVWLDRAADHPRTFYGLIATRALGWDFDFNWAMPAYTKEHADLLSRNPAGRRAQALVAAGQPGWAEAELLRIDPNRDSAMRTALLAFAGHAGLPALTLRLGHALSRNRNGDYYDAALYPVAPWTPDKGYEVDPALVHAIMRQESRFDPLAESSSGAKGLMQIMPATARYIAGRHNIKLDQNRLEVLSDPQVNLELGQLYLKSLLKERHVKGEMFSLLMAYNAGPGNLMRWKERWPDIEDPLLFIELIPVKETRQYVERVLANYWIYRLRENLPVATLDAVVEGRKAKYAYIPVGEEPYRIALRN